MNFNKHYNWLGQYHRYRDYDRDHQGEEHILYHEPARLAVLGMAGTLEVFIDELVLLERYTGDFYRYTYKDHLTWISEFSFLSRPEKAYRYVSHYDLQLIL